MKSQADCCRTLLIYLFLTIADVSYGRFMAMLCKVNLLAPELFF